MKQRSVVIVAVLVALGLALFALTSGKLNKPAASEPVTAPVAQPASNAVVNDTPPPLPTVAPAPVGSALAALLSNGEVPALPESAPKHVTFGVVLYSYAGAQGAATNAPSKAEALERAQAALAQANTDFSEAAKKGDSGSVANAGRIPRGILEPALEFVLFTLQKGQVFPEPLDTPRGYWILRRVD